MHVTHKRTSDKPVSALIRACLPVTCTLSITIQEGQVDRQKDKIIIEGVSIYVIEGSLPAVPLSVACMRMYLFISLYHYWGKV